MSEPLIEFDEGLWQWKKGSTCHKLDLQEIDIDDPKSRYEHDVVIRLDGRPNSKFAWQDQVRAGRESLTQGKTILWHIELGLYDGVYDLADEALTHCAKLSLQYFFQIIWPEFGEKSIGIILDELKPFAESYPWTHSQVELLQQWAGEKGLFRSDPAELSSLEYLLFIQDILSPVWAVLASQCPDDCHSFIKLDLSGRQLCLASQALALSKERFEYMHPIVKGVDPRLTYFAWDVEHASASLWQEQQVQAISSLAFKKPNVGIVLPVFDMSFKALEPFIEKMADPLLDKIAFRTVPESMIMQLWQDLDYLICPYPVKDMQTKRQLKGFEATGGQIFFTQELFDEKANNHWKELLTQIFTKQEQT